ncbi:MAG TPA: PQQ-binding-like beta-propeller repeat protein [Solirubrobacterales bacterium]|nr:PQQ-binding-like beta-propeller repeat protein [Solirubrobacterales bacterium]
MAAALLLVAIVVAVPLSGCGSSSDGAEFTGSGYPGVDLANTRNVDAAIDSSNVSELEVAWSMPLEAQSAYGSYASTPIISNGVIYSQDLVSNVQAIDLASGEVKWEKDFESPSHGPNGLVVADGLVFGSTADEAFALDQESGDLVWKMPLTVKPTEAIDMAPGYHDGKVYISTVPVTLNQTYGPGAVGTLWALDGKTGKKTWHFDTVDKNLWGHPEVNSGGGLWYPPSFDEKGSVFIGTGNPGPLPGTPKYPFGSSRPGANLYADSMVKLDEQTGKVDWHYQQTPHNIYDWDFQNPPVLVSDGGKQLAVGSGKSGVVVALDAKTGKPVWKQPVGTHNGHDDDPLLAMRGEYSKIKPGEVFPGALGGVIAPLAADATTLYVPIVNHSLTLVNGAETSESGPATGELVALDIASGKFKWKKKLPAPAYGAPTVVGDIVFQTDSEGTIYGLDTKTGGEVWQSSLPAGTNVGVMANGEYLVAAAGLPLVEGQVPELVAYKLGG